MIYRKWLGVALPIGIQNEKWFVGCYDNGKWPTVVIIVTTQLVLFVYHSQCFISFQMPCTQIMLGWLKLHCTIILVHLLLTVVVIQFSKTTASTTACIVYWKPAKRYITQHKLSRRENIKITKIRNKLRSQFDVNIKIN